MALRNIVNKKPGAVLIINCITFKEDFKLSNRPASICDVYRLRAIFYLMNFSVQILNDPYYEDIQKKIAEMSQLDFTDFGSLVIVFMTHGDTGDVLFCRDEKFHFKDTLTGLFQNENKSLQEISKYIIVEACKGAFDPNLSMHDSISTSLKNIPNLIGIVMSSVEGFVSFMFEDGSAFIEALCNVLSDYCKTGGNLPFWDVLRRIQVVFDDDQQCAMVVNYKGSDNFTLHSYLEH